MRSRDFIIMGAGEAIEVEASGAHDPAGSDETAYREHERPVMAMLATRYSEIERDARRELYHEAWASVLKRRREGTEIDSLRGYLIGAADKAASKRVYGADARRRFSFDPSASPLRAVADPDAAPDEVVLATDEARRLRLLVDELDGAEAAFLKLRIDEGLEPAEIRERLGLNDRQYRRIAERAAKALVGEFEAFDRGDWAKRKRSLLCACVVGIASERQRRRAEQLVSTDPLCRVMMSELRRLAGQVAAVLPIPAASGAIVEPGGVRERFAELAADAKSRISGLADPVPRHGPRGRAAEVVSGAKQQAANLYVRTADPTPLTGARPGAAVAMVAGCLAASGGAFCAVQGVPSALLVTDPPRAQVEHRHQPRIAHRKTTHKEATVSQTVTTPAAVAPPALTPTVPIPAAQPAPAAQAPQPQPASPTTEFEPGAEAAAPVSTPAPPAAAPKPARPAAATGGSGEFAP